MEEAVLIPDTVYRYCFDDGINSDALNRVVDLWRRMWSRLPEDVKRDWAHYMDRRRLDQVPIVAFLAKDNPRMQAYAWSLGRDYPFLFKPEVLALFSDESILAICSHEFAHLYLTAKGDEYHRFAPTSRDRIECERRADNCARDWGFHIDESRDEEKRLRVQYPDAFTPPSG